MILDVKETPGDMLGEGNHGPRYYAECEMVAAWAGTLGFASRVWA